MEQREMRPECRDLFQGIVESQSKASKGMALLESILHNHMRHINKELQVNNIERKWHGRFVKFCVFVSIAIFGCVIRLVM